MNIKSERTAKSIAVATFSLLAATVSIAFTNQSVIAQASAQNQSAAQTVSQAAGEVPASECVLTPQQAKATTESSGSTRGAKAEKAQPEAKAKKLAGPLKGSVTETEIVTVSVPDPHARIDGLVKLAIERDEQTALMNKKAKTYGNVFKKALVRTSDMLQFATAYKGFEASSEAADVVLDEKLKLKSHAAVQYAKQRQYDEKHTKITLSMLHIAQALGTTDEARKGKTINAGYEQLKELLGEQLAKQTVNDLVAWSRSVQVDDSAFSQPAWDVLDLDEKTKKVVNSTMEQDAVVAEIKRQLHKYNHKSMLSRATSKVVNTTLSIAMFSPTIISPAAQIAMFAYVAATGGPEEAKLLNELYLDRRFESRWKSVNSEANMSVHNYNTAVMTRNPVLLRFSESLMNKMAGPDTVAKLQQPEVAPQQQPAVPAENKAISSTGNNVQ